MPHGMNDKDNQYSDDIEDCQKITSRKLLNICKKPPRMKGKSSHTGRLDFFYEVVIYVWSRIAGYFSLLPCVFSTHKYKMKNLRLCIATSFFPRRALRRTGFRNIRAAVKCFIEAHPFGCNRPKVSCTLLTLKRIVECISLGDLVFPVCSGL